MKYSKVSQQKGFTLVETLIYVAIIGVVITTFIQFILAVSSARNKVYSVQEVQSNIRTSADILGQYIRSATGVVTSTSVFGIHPSKIVLQMPTPLNDPTIITIDNGALVMKNGGNPTSTITSNRVDVTDFTVDHVSDVFGGNKDNFKIDLTIDYVYQDSKGFTYQDTIHTAISTRQ